MSDDLIVEAKGVHYVYALYKSSGEIFYVGKGKGKRVLSHFNPKAKTNIHAKRIILNEKEKGLEPYYEILCSDMSEENALDLEELIIKTVGRIKLGTGPLSNFTDGGEGVKNIVFSEEEKKRRSERAKKNNTHLQMMTKEARKKHSEKMTGKMVGKLNPYYGKTHNDMVIKKMSMYNHSSVRKSDKILKLWLLSEQMYKYWFNNKDLPYEVYAELYSEGVKSRTLINILNRFKSGWCPSEDKDYKGFKIKYGN